MSIYSGFATRQQEELYDSYTQRMFILLQDLIHQLLQQQKPNEKFSLSFSRLFLHMRKMEKYKYLKPKISDCLQPLYNTCMSIEYPNLKTKTKNFDKSDVNISSRLDDIQPDKASLTNQKDLILEYQAQAHKRSQSFRLRPSTTKYSSVSKSKSTASKPKFKEQDEDVKSIVEQYLGGTMKAGLARAQRHYLKAYKRHQKQYGDAFSSNNMFKT